ncbi:MAG: hypothetical protein L6R40_004777 [Gallowayella cf. fulva]|nr:MAG: hypothetical protein L6R40_004777 [Xanthomendoza cf. fulva]
MALPALLSLTQSPLRSHQLSSSSALSTTHDDLRNPTLQPKLNLLSMPVNVLQHILSYVLTSPLPLILQRDTSISPTYRSNITASTLFVNRQLYHTSLPILYGSNTFKTSSPTTSYDFDIHLSALSGRNRLLIRNIKLEIEWAAQLWKKFPLVAMRLLELKGLKSLKLHFVDRQGCNGSTEVVVQGSKRGKEVMRGREGYVGEVLLKAEKKMLEDLVEGLKGLRVFELRGFADMEFAQDLERWVRRGRRC